MSRNSGGTRRDFLRTLGAAGFVGFAGCNTDPSTSTDTLSPTSTETSIGDQNSTSTDTPIDTPTDTPVDDTLPEFLELTAQPYEEGTVLEVYMKGEDNRGLAEARVVYGAREIAVQPDGNTVVIDDRFEDTASVSPDDGRVAYVLADGAGNKNHAYVQPDDTAPELAFSAEPTKKAGEVAVEIDAQDDTGLAVVRALLGGQMGEEFLNKEVAGQQRYTDSLTFTAPPDERFQKGPVTAMVEDWNGNSRKKEVQTYIRKYDTADDTRLDIAGLYNPQIGRVWQNCLTNLTDTRPALGIPGDPIASETTTGHFDQMTGHGITTAVYTTIGHPDNRYWLEEFLQSDLVDTIQIGARYWTSTKWRWTESADSWKDIVESDMSWIQENILSRENARTYDNRPVVSLGDAGKFLTPDMRGRIKEEWGSYDNFIEDFRTHLSVDGKDPFLVCGFQDYGFYGYSGRKESFAKLFDGVQNWLGRGPHTGEDKAIGWENLLTWMEENYQGHREFVENHDMEFIPVVFPGFNERVNECRDAGRYTPRSQEGFKNLLELADEYRTTDMINIGTWNAWSEGTQIEPGTWKGENYGTEYLEIVKKFQSN